MSNGLSLKESGLHGKSTVGGFSERVSSFRWWWPHQACSEIWYVQANESQRESDAASREFMLKATELAMDGETVLAAMNRATALQAFFGDELPADYASRFTGEGTRGLDPQLADPDFGARLVSLIAEHPADCDLIVDAWLDVFRGAQWAKRIECT
jgi:creatinine amidohydrolase/Fe(II)-dependent formamide hydrolase-like protein